MNFSVEYLIYVAFKIVECVVCRLPAKAALGFGRWVGTMGYYIDTKHKSIAYANLKIAFAKTKKPSEIKHLVKKIFQNFGQNSVDLLRLRLISALGAEKFIKVEGKECIEEALRKNKGLILLAMHFGSWEMTNLINQLLGHPYKVITKPQTKFSKLDELLNSYRQCGGSVVLSRGRDTRDLIESLKNNEIVGIVVDQGGRDGTLVKFFGRGASMSTGAIKLGLKFDIPICFSVIIREKGPFHRLVFHPPLKLEKSGDMDNDVIHNLNKIVTLMEYYIVQYPTEYNWFYKIWKYSREAAIVILNDGRVGHLRQSQAVARALEKALLERGIHSTTEIMDIKFKNTPSAKMLSFVSHISSPYFLQGRLRYFKWFLTKESYRKISSVKADYVISCGSSMAGANFLLSNDCRAKSIVILKPGILGLRKFHLVILPEHDIKTSLIKNHRVVVTCGAPNLIDENYLNEHSALLLDHFPHLRERRRIKIGVLLGGVAKRNILGEAQAKVIVSQLKDAAEKLNADILLTTSRRTPFYVESILQKGFTKYPLCPLLIIANRHNVPEAVGGILGLSDIVVVSNDSISMISEAASSGKDVIVFRTKRRIAVNSRSKHDSFSEHLNHQGFVFLCDERNLSESILDVAKNKIKTKTLNDNPVIFEAVKTVI